MYKIVKAICLTCLIVLSVHKVEAGSTDQFLAKFRSVDTDTKRAYARTFSKYLGQNVRFKRTMFKGIAVYKLEKSLDSSLLEAYLSRINDRRIEYLEPDHINWPTAVPNDTYYGNQWHYYEATGGINVEEAWDITDGGGDHAVVVVDTGYRPHADLIGNIVQGYDFISEAAAARDGDGWDPDASDEGDWIPVAGQCNGVYPPQPTNSSWHGTHVAGTIAAVTNNNFGVAGVAYGVKVVPVRALGVCGGYTSDIVDGMIWGTGVNPLAVYDDGDPNDEDYVTELLQNHERGRVINLSLGGESSCSNTWQTGLDFIHNDLADLFTVVVAAGNDNMDVANFSPANCDHVLTIAATNRQGSKSSFSNYGDEVDLAAPGGEPFVNNWQDAILSHSNFGLQGPEADAYSWSVGTSMAAPHVSGVIALMLSVKNDLTNTQIQQILIDTARPFPGSCNGCGAGIVDAKAAVDAVLALP